LESGFSMTTLAPREIAGLGFEQVVRHAPVAVSVVDVAGRVIYTNERLQELANRQLGRDVPADVADAIDIFHPDGRRYKPEEWPLKRVIATGERIVDEEFHYLLPDGGRLFVRCSCFPIRDEAGDVVAGVLALVDITGDRQIAERLAYYDRLLETTEDAVIAVNPEMRITLWSRAAERLYGWSAEEVLGIDSRELFGLILSDDVRERFDREFPSRGRSRMELTARRRDGSTVEVEWIVDALRGANGKTSGCSAFTATSPSADGRSRRCTTPSARARPWWRASRMPSSPWIAIGASRTSMRERCFSPAVSPDRS
jgi:PAS domain S-box-containing protein